MISDGRLVAFEGALKLVIAWLHLGGKGRIRDFRKYHGCGVSRYNIFFDEIVGTV